MIDGMELTGRRKKFCIEYLRDWNATQAAVRAGYSADTARQIGSRLLTKDDIKTEIVRLRDEVFKKEKDNLRLFVLQKLKNIAQTDITDVVEVEDESVKVKDTKTIKKSVRESIEQISETVTKDGGSLSVKMHSKVKALELLGRCAGIFDDKLELSGGLNNTVTEVDRIDAFRSLQGKIVQTETPDDEHTTLDPDTDTDDGR